MRKTSKKRVCFFVLALIFISIITARIYLDKKPEGERKTNIILVDGGVNFGAKHDKGGV